MTEHQGMLLNLCRHWTLSVVWSWLQQLNWPLQEEHASIIGKNRKLLKFNVVHFLCNNNTHIKFNINFLHNVSFYLLIKVLTCFGIGYWPSSGSS